MLLTILSFIFVFAVVTLAHELGHFIWAKRAGIRVYEFALGFGPRLFSTKRGDTTYGLCLFPLGGFVRLAGIEGEEEEEKSCPEEQKYYNKTTAQKFKSIVAGPLMNIFLAFIIIYFVLLFLGIPVGISNEIALISPGSPAQQAGLLVGDKILALNGQKTEGMEKVIDKIHKSAGTSLRLTILRHEKEFDVSVVPKYDPRLKAGLIGFSPLPIYEKHNPLASLWLAVQQTVGMVVLIVLLLGQLIIGKVSVADLAGPVGIAQITGQVAQHGFVSLLSFLAFLSVNLGVVNLLPIPALDGGRLFFLLIEFIRKKPLDIKTENKIHYVGLIVLLTLMALITINDVLRIFRR